MGSSAAQIASADAVNQSSAVMTTVIPANGVYGFSQYGERFYFQTLTAGILAKTEHTVFRPYYQRQGEQFPVALRFQRVELSNPNAFPVLVRIWAGFGEFLDSTFNIIESFTEAVGRAATFVAAGASVVLPGTPTGNQLQRKALVVSNPDSALDLQILDANDNIVDTVFFRTSAILPIAGSVKVHNPNGSDVTCSISEIWYTENTPIV